MTDTDNRTHRIAPDLFLSYAREDLADARRLAAQIEAAGFSVAMDVNDVAPGEDWQVRLDQLLQGAAKVLFLATPVSIGSAACARELEAALREGKPILTVMLGTLPREALPEYLRHLHYTRLPEGADLEGRLAGLVAAIGADLSWERRKAAYIARAAEAGGGLLHGRAEVTAAETWAVARPGNAAPVPMSVREMIVKSRTRLTRQLWLAMAGLALISVVISALGLQAYQRSRLAETRNGVLLVNEAERLSGELRTDAAVLTLLHAADLVADSGPDSPEVRRVEAAMTRILDRAEREKRYEIPGDSGVFEHANALYYITKSGGGLWTVDPDLGPRKLADWPGALVEVSPLPGNADFPMALAILDGKQLVLFAADPATGRRGPLISLPTTANVPTDLGVMFGPDGKAILRLPQVPISSLGFGEAGDFDNWLAELGTGDLRAEPRLTDWVDLEVMSDGRSLIREPRDGEEDRVTDFTLAPVVVPDPLASSYFRCLTEAGFGTETLARAQEKADNLRNNVGSNEGVSEDNCATSAAHSARSEVFYGSGGSLINTAVWQRSVFLDTSLVLWSAETFGWQTTPSLFSASDNSTTLAIADISSVVVLRTSIGEYEESIDELRVPFIHNVDHAVAIGANRIMAVEGYFAEETRPVKRVTVLDLPLPKDDTAGEFGSAGTIAEPAWNDVCITRMPDDSDYPSFLWVSQNQVEVSPGRTPDNIVTLAPELLDQLDGKSPGKDTQTWTDPVRIAICLNITADGSQYFADLSQDDPLSETDVYLTVDGNLSFTLPPLSPDIPMVLRPGLPEALISEDRRTVERLWQDADGSWQRIPVFYAPHAIVDLFLAPGGDTLVVTYLFGAGLVEARAISLADYREVADLGSRYKFITPEWDDDGAVVLPELGARLKSLSFSDGINRLASTLSPECRPQSHVWKTSACWPKELP